MKTISRGIGKFFRYYFTDYNPISGFWSEAIYSWWEQLFWNVLMGTLLGLFYGFLITALFGLIIGLLSNFETIPWISQFIDHWIELLQTRKRYNF